MTTPTCTHCGHPLHPSHYDKFSVLSLTERRVFDAIHKAGQAGATRSHVFGKVYGADPNGGPETLNVICVHVKNINRKIGKLKLQIRSTMGHHARYMVMSL